MKNNSKEIIEEVLKYVDGKTYTTANGLAKDIKSLGYSITEIVDGEYVAFKVKGTTLSFLAFLSDKKPYYCFDVDEDIVFNDKDENEKSDEEKKNSQNKKKRDNIYHYDKSYSINHGEGYIY